MRGDLDCLRATERREFDYVVRLAFEAFPCS